MVGNGKRDGAESVVTPARPHETQGVHPPMVARNAIFQTGHFGTFWDFARRCPIAPPQIRASVAAADGCRKRDSSNRAFSSVNFDWRARNERGLRAHLYTLETEFCYRKSRKKRRLPSPVPEMDRQQVTKLGSPSIRMQSPARDLALNIAGRGR
jgi:hypothetical protein